MDISKKTLIVSIIINILLVVVCAVCLIITKFNSIVLWISIAVMICVVITSVIVYLASKKFR